MQTLSALVYNTLACVIHMTVANTESISFVHLSLADGMMGLYLLSMVFVNFIYSGIFTTIIVKWKMTMLCILIGSFNFLSSEMSLLLLVFICGNRAKNIFQMRLICHIDKYYNIFAICAWVTMTLICMCIMLSIVYVSSVKINNNMCHYFIVTGDYEATLTENVCYITAIVVDILLLSLMIGACVSVLKVMHTEEIFQSPKGKKDSLRVKLFLLVLVFINLVCWVPVLIVNNKPMI